jgi:hypothetical protein
MNKHIFVIVGLFFIQSQLLSGGEPFPRNAGSFRNIRTPGSVGEELDSGHNNTPGGSESGQGPVVIHYGPNDSHSKDWVQENPDGVVGVTYFQLFDGSDDQGVLTYKTIHPDGSSYLDSVTTGIRLEKSVLLYDSLSTPHIYLARSNDVDQVIDHYWKSQGQPWQNETIINFLNEGGKFIYELSADKGQDGSFHLLILKTRSNIDSEDYWWAWLDSYLYHMTNETGVWEKELIHNYDMAYTYDNYIKSSIRQDIEIDEDGFIHVVFSEQMNANDDPSRLLYATNKTGAWVIETALHYDHGPRDDAGWFPSLCLDNNGVPYVSCI